MHFKVSPELIFTFVHFPPRKCTSCTWNRLSEGENILVNTLDVTILMPGVFSLQRPSPDVLSHFSISPGSGNTCIASKWEFCLSKDWIWQLKHYDRNQQPFTKDRLLLPHRCITKCHAGTFPKPGGLSCTPYWALCLLRCSLPQCSAPLHGTQAAHSCPNPPCCVLRAALLLCCCLHLPLLQTVVTKCHQFPPPAMGNDELSSKGEGAWEQKSSP